MASFLPDSRALVFLGSYVVCALALALINRSDFKRSPEKGERYRALPIGYKLLCWFVVLPMFAGTMIIGPLFIPALLGYMLLEAACMRWYRKTGLLP
jgi:hypothetical protein